MKVIKGEPVYEQVYRALRDSIVSGEFAPGVRLIETQLAEVLGVSRTPVREAIRMLINDRLVIPLANGGVMVYKPSEEEIIELHECRRGLEPVAAELAAQRMSNEMIEKMIDVLHQADEALKLDNMEEVLDYNTQFHDLVLEGSENKRLIKMVNELRMPLLQYRVVNLHFYEGREFLNDHWQIAEAIKSRNSELAAEKMRQHILNDEKADLQGMRM